MVRYGAESTGDRHQLPVAAFFLVVALAGTVLPEPAQQSVAAAIRGSALRPFIAIQERLALTRLRAAEVDVIRARMDSLAAAVSTRAALADENRRLRALLGLAGRVGPSFRPATVLRPGTPGSESMFLVSVGSEDGVARWAPVIDHRGLVGVIREVRARVSVGMDWTHPDFRASAMTEDGAAYGIVENRRGDFREEDRLVLTGGAYHEDVPGGTPIVTSGLGGVFPRGIPIGAVDAVAEVRRQWRKSYWIRPRVHPGEVTHALVAVGEPSLADLSPAFDSAGGRTPLPEDTVR